MKLMLSVARQAGDEINNITIGHASATIGRSADNTLVLEDSHRYISGHHAIIDYRAPDYFMTDLSTNGVLINDAIVPVGDANSIKLNDGDILHIADYTLAVSIIGKQQVDLLGAPFAQDVFDISDDPFAELSSDPVQEVIDENPIMPGQSNHLDPFGGLNISGFDDIGADISEQNEQGSIRGNPPPPVFKEAFQPAKPEKKEQQTFADDDVFAMDWFNDKQNEDATSEELFPEDFFVETKVVNESAPDIKVAVQSVEKVEAEEVQEVQEVEEIQVLEAVEENVEEIERTDTAEPSRRSPPPDLQKLIVDNFLRGVGLEKANISESLTPESFYIIGKILRASIQGTMDVLIGRAKIKNEMHLDVTTIKPLENNPVKFSVSVDEAIRKLLAPQDAGYLKADAAIEEAFDDIRAHQVSVISGMQTAFLEVLKRFDPQKLEQRLQKQSPLSASIPIHKQAKLWRLFEHLYDDLELEASDNFYHLFGEAFAESYEQQMIELKNSKKESPF